MRHYYPYETSTDKEYNPFPVGYKKFHRKEIFNYQLNRWYSSGYLPEDKCEDAAKKIKNIADWRREMTSQAEQSLEQEKWMEASFFYRAAEFFTFRGDIPCKNELYDRFSMHFDAATYHEPIERAQVTYQKTWLPAMRIPSLAHDKFGTIIIHGGFDSLIEESYTVMKYLAHKGYEVICFEGPGQGYALMKNELSLDYRWEKPVKAVLDFYGLTDVTLFGLSLGGWSAMRAAAFEKRVKRVIANGHAIDYLEIPPKPISWLNQMLIKYQKSFNKRTFSKMKNNLQMEWEVKNRMHITKTVSPLKASKYMLHFSRKNMRSERIKQDVLLLTGRNDHFVPLKMHQRQVEALIHAKSVTDRIFTKSEHAQNHCQVGNISLMLDVVDRWIRSLV